METAPTIGSIAVALLFGIGAALPAPAPPRAGSGPETAAPAPTPIPIGTTTIELPTPNSKSATSLEEALIGRNAARQFSPAPVTVAEVGQLLWAAQGITDKKWGRRAAPTASGLYPLEVILVAANVAGLPAAVYRYRPLSHELMRTVEGDPRPQIAEACKFQPLASAPAIIVITAVQARTAKLYDGQASRLVALEAGAASQDLLLEAVALHLGCGMLVSFDDAKIVQAIGAANDERPLTIVALTQPPAAAHP